MANVTAKWDAGNKTVGVYRGELRIATVVEMTTMRGSGWKVMPLSTAHKPSRKLHTYPSDAIDSMYGGRCKVQAADMNVKAALVYGTSEYPVDAPAIQADPYTMDDYKLARICLRHMSKHAGGYVTSMAEKAAIAHHPAGCVFVHGNGWLVNFESEAYTAAAKAAAADTSKQAFADFVAQYKIQPLDAGKLLEPRIND